MRTDFNGALIMIMMMMMIMLMLLLLLLLLLLIMIMIQMLMIMIVVTGVPRQQAQVQDGLDGRAGGGQGGGRPWFNV